MLFILILVCLCLLGEVGINAYCSQLQKSINSLSADTVIVQNDIDKLSAQIETARNISTIERRAQKELHMVLAKGDGIKYLKVNKYKMENLTEYLRERAYASKQ